MREWVENGPQGRLGGGVHLQSRPGVDFLPVERVLQVGTAKGVARLMQRAGRSGHAPGRASRVTLVPTHSLELVEAVAARQAIAERRIEARLSPEKPLDVLVQHLVSMALGGGFTSAAMLAEVRSCWPTAPWATTNGPGPWPSSATADTPSPPTPSTAAPSPTATATGVPSAQLARRHRQSIGTIVSDASLQVRFWGKGGAAGSLGSIEEGFISRLRRAMPSSSPAARWSWCGSRT